MTIRRAADRVRCRLRTSRYGDAVNHLLTDHWQGEYPSQSEADYNLVLLGSFHTDDTRVLDALVQTSGLCREKWLGRRDRDYAARTIAAALAQRAQLQAARLTQRRTSVASQIAQQVRCSWLARRARSTHKGRKPAPVIYVAFGTPETLGKESRLAAKEAVLRVTAALPEGAPLSRLDIAAGLGVERATVWRAIRDLSAAGLIDAPEVDRRKTAAGWESAGAVWLRMPLAEALAAIKPAGPAVKERDDACVA